MTLSTESIAAIDLSLTTRERNPSEWRIALTGVELALPGEDASAIDRLGEDLVHDLTPTTTLSLILIEHMVVATVRSRRCTRFERASTSNAVRDALPRFDEDRLEDVDLLMRMIIQCPEVFTRRLQRKPEGLDRMLLEWQDLAGHLDHPYLPEWSGSDLERADNLLGHHRLEFPCSRLRAVSGCIWGNFTNLNPDDAPDLDAAGKKAWARDQIRAIIVAEVARLEALRAVIDRDPVAGARLDATDVATFDPSKLAAENRKYHAACNRMFHKSLATIREVEAAAAKSRAVDATQASATTSATVGSFSQTASRAPSVPTPPTSMTLRPPVAGPDHPPEIPPTLPRYTQVIEEPPGSEAF